MLFKVIVTELANSGNIHAIKESSKISNRNVFAGKVPLDPLLADPTMVPLVILALNRASRLLARDHKRTIFEACDENNTAILL